MSQTPFSASDLRLKLTEHLAFLNASAQAFDAGIESESLRLAASARVLLHDTRRSHALLAQLGLTERLFLPDTGNPFPPHLTVAPDGNSFTVCVGLYLRLAWMQMSAPPVDARFVPKLADVGPSPRVPFEQWWKTSVLRAPGATEREPPRELTRRDVVLGLANKEGGAHVDPNPTFEWWIATRSGAYGKVLIAPDGQSHWEVPLGDLARGGNNEGSIVTPVHATMRTIAEELRLALNEGEHA